VRQRGDNNGVLGERDISGGWRGVASGEREEKRREKPQSANANGGMVAAITNGMGASWRGGRGEIKRHRRRQRRASQAASAGGDEISQVLVTPWRRSGKRSGNR